MKKTHLIILLALACLLAPIIVAMLINIDIPFEWVNENDWIGFSGSYVGAILGGVITLFVMEYNIKNNECNMKTERKRNYFDEILKELVEYHIGLRSFLLKMQKNEFLADKEIENMVIKSEILTIKLTSKKDNTDYIECNEMMCSLENVTTKLNKIIKLINEDKKDECFIELCEDEEKELKVFIEKVEDFYVKNAK